MVQDTTETRGPQAFPDRLDMSMATYVFVDGLGSGRASIDDRLAKLVRLGYAPSATSAVGYSRAAFVGRRQMGHLFAQRAELRPGDPPSHCVEVSIVPALEGEWTVEDLLVEAVSDLLAAGFDVRIRQPGDFTERVKIARKLKETLLQ